ncbi:MAG: hypothetical protein AMJ54_02645 [Deltaproteobacteria bacterium SG8_13]|nr:MAG: hypothetical protein AMJ54_02645 [Deltaproteobacteria bacterium SG8_13]
MSTAVLHSFRSRPVVWSGGSVLAFEPTVVGNLLPKRYVLLRHFPGKDKSGIAGFTGRLLDSRIHRVLCISIFNHRRLSNRSAAGGLLEKRNLASKRRI